jgi:hypothetical protein
MNDAILIQQVSAGEGHPDEADYRAMLDLTQDRHAEYCQAHGFDYELQRVGDPRYPANTGAWVKVKLMIDAMQKGYQSVVWLDTDALVWDMDADLRGAVRPGKVGLCWQRIPQFPQGHWNVGVMYVDNTPGTLGFMQDWLASYPPPADGWGEQGVFNRLAAKSPLVETVSDRWNATIDVSMVPDAVVLGFHGQGPGSRRLALMRKAMQMAEAREKVEA